MSKCFPGTFLQLFFVGGTDLQMNKTKKFEFKTWDWKYKECTNQY